MSALSVATWLLTVNVGRRNDTLRVWAHLYVDYNCLCVCESLSSV